MMSPNRESKYPYHFFSFWIKSDLFESVRTLNVSSVIKGIDSGSSAKLRGSISTNYRCITVRIETTNDGNIRMG